MKTKLGRMVCGVLTGVCLIGGMCATPASASETNPNVYLYVPVKTGAEAAALFENSTADDGTDADVTYDADKDEVAITYQAGVEEAGAEEAGAVVRKRTEVNLDLAPVNNHRLKYVSFDISLDSLMDLVVSFEPYEVSQDLDNRPHSLYFTDSGYMASTQHARKHKYNTKGNADGYKAAITGDWWIKDAKITQQYEADKSINVKMIASSMTGNAANISATNTTKRLEYDEVQVYINGVRKGQLISAARLDSWTNAFMHFAHYTTESYEQVVYLKNLEVGFCEKTGKDELNNLDPNAENKTWNFPEGNNTYISITLPTTGDNAYYVQPSIGAGGSSFMWFKNMGVLTNWDGGAFNADGTCKNGTLAAIKSWHNVHAWDGSSEVTVTYEINKAFGTVECYDSLGHWRKVYRDIPTSVSIHDVVGDVKPTKVVSGVFVGKGITILDSSNNAVTSFDKNTGKVKLSEFGTADKDEDLNVIFAWFDETDRLIKVDISPIKADKDGLYAISANREIGSEAPSGARCLKTFIWDSGSCKPVRAMSNPIQGSV